LTDHRNSNTRENSNAWRREKRREKSEKREREKRGYLVEIVVGGGPEKGQGSEELEGQKPEAQGYAAAPATVDQQHHCQSRQ
jgi:hypothetical protein